jgi:hypothetical protein
MSGRWLEEHGFAIGSGVQVVVEQGRVTLISAATHRVDLACQRDSRVFRIGDQDMKKHLDNIYAKLAVRGRMEAIARARELKLL